MQIEHQQQLFGASGECGIVAYPHGPFTLKDTGGNVVIVPALAHVLAVVNKPTCHGLESAVAAVTQGDGEALPLLQRGDARSGLRVDMPTPCLVQQMFAEMMAIEGRRVKPWQMRRLDWEGFNAIGATTFGCYSGIAGSDEAKRWMDRAFLDAFGYGHNGPVIDRQIGTNARYEVHVEYALAAGEPVPQESVDDARRSMSDAGRAMADEVGLRGRLSLHALRILIGLLKRAGLRATAKTGEPFLQVVLAMVPERRELVVDMDDALYAAGLLAPEPSATPPVPAATVADVDVQALAEQLYQRRVGQERGRLDGDRAAGRVSKRTYEAAIGSLETGIRDSDIERAGHIVGALRTKNVRQLLHALDVADDHNRTSRKFAKDRFGLATLGVRAAERRRRIFAFCDMSDDDAKRFEVEEKERKAADESGREARRAAERAEEDRRITERVATTAKVQFDGSEMTFKALIDRLIATGYSEIREIKKGAVAIPHLVNPNDRRAVRLSKRNPSLAYGRLALAAAKAAAEVARTG